MGSIISMARRFEKGSALGSTLIAPVGWEDGNWDGSIDNVT